MLLRVTLLLFTAVPALLGAAPAGIPRDLARQRAQEISEVRYHVHFVLIPRAASASGHEEIEFHLNSATAVLLDFREGKLGSLAVNGKSAAATVENGHIELPANLLQAGLNTVTLDFNAPVAPAGKAITRFEDKDDNTEYLYTLFVPMDASMAFPCFDQPDLKARFRLEITAPVEWTVISNTAAQGSADAGVGQRHTIFAETRPISTYLFAFAAGPFRKVHETPGLPGLYVRQSKLKKAEEEAGEVQTITAEGIKYLTAYFAQPFPFPKYDMVMIPGFAYGGMEHAGATFLNEESILFRTVPTHTTIINRELLLLHELTHQWFGDLTTMRWFDDLWLKEGFAQFMAYHALADLKPSENMWKRFYQNIKPAAYGIDETKGTTPIYQDVPNLKDAKSAYGAIVYSKAPAILKQLAYILGDDKFREGLRIYLREHAYANAEWGDLVNAFERASGRQLGDWANAWIHRRGMPRVDVSWACDQNRVTRFLLAQHDVLNEGGIWPIATQVLFQYADASPVELRAELNGKEAELPGAVGKPCPQYVFANNQDYAYGRFLLDSQSQKIVRSTIGHTQDVFLRTLLWGALWDAVWEAQLAPRDCMDLALQFLPSEKDEALAQTQVGRTVAALHYYISPATRTEFLPHAQALASDLMLHSAEQDFRIIGFRALRTLAESPESRAQLKDLLRDKLTVPGITLRPLDRWNMVAALIAMNDPDANLFYTAEQKRDPSGDGQKYAYMAAAAKPDAQSKQQYFNDFLHDPSRPEDWVSISLGSFNYWNQSDLTFSYLKPALEALPQIKRERKIFFVLNWLDAFIGGQQSEAADTEVHEFLDKSSLDKDLQLKVLQVVDGLDHIVKIRKAYP